MKDLTFSVESSGVFLKQDSDKETVFIAFDDLPELVEKVNEAIKHKEEDSILNNVIIREDGGQCILFEQTFDNETVQVNKADIPKLIKILQGMIKE